MSAPEVGFYWEMRAKAAEARLAAEIQRCGRAEGALDVTQQSLRTAEKRIAALQAELDEARGEIGDLWDERDALTVKQEIGRTEGRVL